MERIISPEERLRRAEEIYYRRKAQGVRVSTASVNVGKSNKVFLGKKMIIQICICIIIYVFFWGIKGNESVFGKNVIDNIKMILEYDINFQNLYNQCVNFFNNNFKDITKINNFQNNDENVINEENNSLDTNESNKIEEPVTENSTENSAQSSIENGVENSAENSGENSTENKTDENNKVNNEDSNAQIQNSNSQENKDENIGIGGGNDDMGINNVENKTQMELDAEYVKTNCSLIKPVNGRITSGYGDREATQIISAFHQGVDIGAVTGTKIIASMEGTVVAASYAGDYGNHIKIQNGEVLTVYAHCSKLNVKVGDYIKQGQEIGEVGATGKVTRTTFTF